MTMTITITLTLNTIILQVESSSNRKGEGGIYLDEFDQISLSSTVQYSNITNNSSISWTSISIALVRVTAVHKQACNPRKQPCSKYWPGGGGGGGYIGRGSYYIATVAAI